MSAVQLDVPKDVLKELQVICKAVIRQQRGLFGELHQYSTDDLLQEATATAIKRYKQFDKKRGTSFSVVIGEAVKNRLIDIYRVATKSKARERLVASVRHETDAAPNATPTVPSEQPVPVPAAPANVDPMTMAFFVQLIDADIASQAAQIEEADEYEVRVGLLASALRFQMLRRQVVGTFLPIVIGTRKFTGDTFIMFAPKPKQE